MSLNVALIDKSEVIKKMLSHCLHYYAAEIHRFETLDDLKSQSNHLKPDIIFIDWDLKKGDEPLAISAKKEISDTPLVVIYRNGSDEKINSITNRIKKPLDANLLRQMVADLIPKIGRSKIHSFLKFPNKQHEEGLENSKTKKESSQKIMTKSTVDFNLKKTGEKNEEIQSKMAAYLDEISSKKTAATDKSDPISKKPVFNKDELNLDETTLNDFAPMAVKSSYEEQTNPSGVPKKNREDFKTEDEMILKVLEEYKNTLGFESLVEQSLKEYARDLSKKILEKDGGEILKKSLSDFKKEDNFKQLILKTLSEYIKENSEFRSLFEKELQQFIIKELPTLTKGVIEKEIQKLLEDEN